MTDAQWSKLLSEPSSSEALRWCPCVKPGFEFKNLQGPLMCTVSDSSLLEDKSFLTGPGCGGMTGGEAEQGHGVGGG